MYKRKQRFLKNLYQIIPQPEITQVSRGNCQIQGPVDEIEPDFNTHTVPFQIDEGFSRLSQSQKALVTAESGACNVCSAPCSSCLHVAGAPMRLRTKEFYDEPCKENTTSYSVDDVAATVKRRRSKIGQHATSETSTLMNSDSSHDSFTENAQSKSRLRTSDVSGASGNVESSAKLSSGEIFGAKNHSLRSESLTNKNYSAIKFDDPRGLEGHDDNISSVSGAEQTNKSSISVIQTESIILPSSFASADSLGADNGIGAQDLRSASHTPCGEFVSGTLTSKEIVEDSCSHLNGKPECSTREHSSSLLKREEVCDMQIPPSSVTDYIQNSKVGFDDKKLEIGTRNDADLYDEALQCEEQDREVEKVADFLSLPEAKTTSFQSHHVNESDESDIVEHDVKVCDICGDAGREDLLATCCRCSDGAEHTYCMRERLDKVPEDDWLCEECKSTEEIDTQGKDISGTEDRADKDLPSELEDIEFATVRTKLDAKIPDVEGNTTNKGPSSAKGSGKRQADDMEVSTAAKRQALEPVIASPKATHPSRVRSLSRDSSFKNLDSGKVKPNQKFSSGVHFPSGISEAARSPTASSRLQTTGGGFFKSNSFNFSNAKSKVKLVDEVPHKHRSSKEAVSRDAIEGAVRGIGKSLSFKSINSARLSTSESKVKMLSPKFSHVQDLKGSKHINEKNLFERKNSFRSPRSSTTPTTLGSTISVPKGDQKLTSRGESGSLSSTCNAELKAVQSDSRSISAAKPHNLGSRRAAEGAPSTGELKRQLPCLPNVGAASSSSLVERKTIEASMKDELLSNSPAGEDELPRARESTYLPERVKESSTSHLRLSSDAGVSSVSCQICKEIGHSAQLCTVDSHRTLGFDSSVPRNSREEINKGNKLKAAIEAAMLKKPSIYRRNRIPSQSHEISVSSMNNESASQDQLSSSGSMRSMNSVEVMNGKAMRSSDANLSKLPNGTDAKQLVVIPGEAPSVGSGDGSSMVPSDRKHLNMERPSHASVAMSLLLQMSAIPDHEYIWQGSFEVQRGRKTPELWDGFQAHLSTCASPKVIAAVNKFPRRVLLTEVPRLSTWPIQFEEIGVREDNIALYFFAREYESYERSYKILLERMMRSDLALRGNIDGVELLIFPSNQLPEKSQCWNMLYFFWGVFRGKRESCLQQGPVSPKKFCSLPDIPDTIVALPENLCSLGSTEKIVPMPDSANIVVTTAPALVELHSFSSEETKNMEQQDCKPYPISSTSAQIKLDESIPMMFAHIGSDAKVDRELQVSLEATSAACGSSTTMSEKVACDLPFLADRHQASANNSNNVAYAGTSETKLWNDDVNNDKVPYASFVRGDLSPSVECNRPPETENNGERFFFPVDPPSPPRQVKGDNFIPWIGSLQSEKPPSPERTPNLELALGGEQLKSFRLGKGKIDINLDEEPPEEEEEEEVKALGGGGGEVKTFRVGKLDINLDEEPPEEEEEEEEGEILSLSLSVPMAERETGEQGSKPEWSFLEASQTNRR